MLYFCNYLSRLLHYVLYFTAQDQLERALASRVCEAATNTRVCLHIIKPVNKK